MSKKVCSSCKLVVEGNECPLCKGNKFLSTILGRVIVLDPIKSKVADMINAKAKGEFAIKCR
jgi:DNA-directed RNA polymerase subunit E"